MVWEIFLIIMPFGDIEHSVAPKPGKWVVWTTNPVKSGEESPGTLESGSHMSEAACRKHVIFA